MTTSGGKSVANMCKRIFPPFPTQVHASRFPVVSGGSRFFVDFVEYDTESRSKIGPSSLIPFSLLGRHGVLGREHWSRAADGAPIVGRFTARGIGSCGLSSFEQDSTEGASAVGIIACIIAHWEFAVFEDSHNDSPTSVSASVLSKVVTARELLATVVALEWLIMSVEGAIVAL